MSFYDAIRVGSSGDAGDFEVERSLRFNDGDSAYLSRTPSSTSNRKTWTFSAWVKRSNITTGARHTLFSANNSSNYGLYGTYIWFTTTDTFALSINSGTYYLNTNAKFRDVSAWYHVVVAVDTTQATSSNRIKVYVNGVQETSFASSTYPTQDLDTSINLNQQHTVGGRRYSSIDNYFDGYMAEINFIDGQQLTPASFAETNSTTGQWIPKDTSALTFGTNGFRLKFNDNSNTTATTLGKDSSSNGNNYTPNNFSVSAGVDNDSFEDTPTNNFVTMNPLNRGVDNPTCSNGNLYFGGSTDHSIVATFAIPSSGKWYWEYTKTTGTLLMSGIIGDPEKTYLGTSNYFGSQTYAYTVYASNGNKYNAGSAGTYMATPPTSTTIMIAFDADTRKLYFGADGNWGDGSGNTDQTFANAAVAYTVTDGITYYPGGSFNSGSAFANFGQRAFSYKPTGYKSLCSANLPDPTIKLPNKHFEPLIYTGDSNTSRNITGLQFQPDWVWIKRRSATANHRALDSVRGSTKELYPNLTNAESTFTGISSFNSDGFTLATADPNYNLNTATYVAWNWNGGNSDGATYRVVVVDDSGNKYRFRNSANSATFDQSAVTLNLAEGGTYTFDGSDATMASHPIKLSTTANGTHGGGSSYNTGVTYELDGSTVTESAYVSGYSSASSRKLIITVAASAPTLYYYCHVHSGMGGQINTNSTKGSTNFDGSIQSTVKANTTAGFSIVSYEGNNTQGATVGHGLGVAPAVVIVKNRESTYNWAVWHQDLLGAAYVTNLNSTAAQGSIPGVFNGTLPTSTVFSLGGGGQSDRFLSNEPNIDFIVYIFSEVKNYSKFGKYKGNGSTDGVYVYTGFRPALVITKQISGAGSWFLFDNKRNGFNETEPYVMANVSNTEATDLGWDLLSNGFKIRNNYVNTNAANQDYVYLAFAESPFKNNRAR